MTYTTEKKVEAITQLDISSTSNPSTSEVAVWIDEIEADMDAQLLGRYTSTNLVIDVPKAEEEPAQDTIKWMEYVVRYGYFEPSGKFIVPPYIPIIRISRLERRTSGMTEAEAWEELTEGPASGSSWYILKKKGRTGLLGFAIFFYQNQPTAGVARLRLTYDYGWDIPSSILGEYATLKVALKVLEAARQDALPTGTRDYGVGDIRVSAEDLEVRAASINERLTEIEDRYFPSTATGQGVAFF